MKKDLASARPWKVDKKNACVVNLEDWPIFSSRYKDELRANAALTVRAVNNFDALLDACKEAIAYCPEPLRLKLITAITNAEK